MPQTVPVSGQDVTLFASSISNILSFLAVLFIFVIGLAALWLAIAFIADALQKRDAVRRNFPVIGRFRSLFTRLGEFFRQYFFALDREEMPFNRAERDWIYLSAKGANNTHPFGSTLNLKTIGTPIFSNCAFPALTEQAEDPPTVVFGGENVRPYTATSLVNISAMSYGSLSRPAVEALSRGAALAGCWLNTGEGGLAKAHLVGGCDIIFQIGTAKYGVQNSDGTLDETLLKTVSDQPQVRMIELKLAQGAKPGKGGILPAAKVTREISKIRNIPKGKASISPNRHPEINSTDDLLDMIARIRSIARRPVGIKIVLGSHHWPIQLCEAIMKRGIESAPDFITLDGGEGGTGAAPMSLMDNVGLPIRAALPMLVDILESFDLKTRIRIIAAGKLVTPGDVAWAYCAGADVVNTARGFMFSIGCIQAMRCHTNNCPTGVTTHKRHLQKGLDPKTKAPQVANYVDKMRKDVAMIAHACGVPHARALTRAHVRIIQPDGAAVPLDILCEEQRTRLGLPQASPRA